MIRKTVAFEQATQLRRRGFTYVEIAKITNVSKSTISKWLSRETWSIAITEDNKKRAAKENKKRISLLNTARVNQHKKQYVEAERSAVIEFVHYKKSPLFIAGLALYLSNGDLTANHLIRITSSRKEVHRIFVQFAEQFLGVPRGKVRFWLLLYQDQSIEKCTKVWSKALHLSISRFHKPQIAKKVATSSTLHDGIGNTIIGSTVFKRKLCKWVTLIQKEL